MILADINVPWLESYSYRGVFERLSSLGITRILLAPMVRGASPREVKRANSLMEEEASRSGMGVLTAPLVSRELASDILRGCADYGDRPAVLLDRPVIERGELLDELMPLLPRNLVVRLRRRWGEGALRLQRLRAVASMHEERNFILLNANYGDLLQLITLLGDLDNVYLDIACFQSLRGIETLVKFFGPHRVLFGSSYPLCYPEASLLKMSSSTLDRASTRMVACENFSRLFGLRTPS